MVSLWKRIFCTSVSKEELEFAKHSYEEENSALYSPVIASRFSFFSKQSTHDTTSSPALRCRTAANHTPTASISNSPKSNEQATPAGLNSPMLLFQHYFSPRGCVSQSLSSPRSPFGLSLIKSTLRLSRSKCGICGENVKSSGGVDVFTAECRHGFHSKCVFEHMKSSDGSKIEIPMCPVCGVEWKDSRIPPFISPVHRTAEWKENGRQEDLSKKHFRVYNDDEPLLSPSPASLIAPIPENDDVEEEECKELHSRKETVGFSKSSPEIAILQQSATISTSRTHETRAVVLKLTAPRLDETSQQLPVRHTPVDIVALLELNDRSSITRIKLAMGTIISSLSPADRLSVVAFSNVSKRLLPLRRMTSHGKRAARRVVDALLPSGHGMSVNDALKKAAKVIGDRRERNPAASIVVINPSTKVAQSLTTTRLPDHQISIHWLSLGEADANALSKPVNSILTAAFHDVTLQLWMSTSSHGIITAVYPLGDRPLVFPPENVCLGTLQSGEERELLTEVKLPRQSNGDCQQLRVRALYKDASSSHSSSEEIFILPQAYTVRSNVEGIERLRNVHVTTKAIAESRRLIAGGETEAYDLLASARGLVTQSADVSGRDCLRHLDSEIEKFHDRWRQRRAVAIGGADKDELATPTSAWRAAERLAKVAIMRKHMNRVSDLHGFENARF